MRLIPINNLGQVGLIADVPPIELPVNAWTDVKNMRFKDGAVEKFLGHAAQLGTPLHAPQWLLPVTQGGTAFWLYASTERVGATDGASHADITREIGGLYTVNPSSGWTGTIIEGIPVISNGIDAPQMWKFPALSQKLERLSAWPTGYSCNTLVGLKRYLVALDVSKAGVRFPTMVKWSHQAPTGDVPQSWSVADDTVDSGEYTLPGEGGYLVDGSPLRDGLILYKEYQTWGMQYVGGVEIFRFSKLFDNIGAITRRCAIEFFSGKQLVYTGDDVVLHDGHQAKSIADARIRRFISGLIDTANYNRAFVSADYASSEVWVCIPEAGQDSCTIAGVWNWLSDTWSTRQLPNVRHATNGIVNPIPGGETWDSATGVWDTDTQAWGDRTADPTKRKLLLANEAETQLFTQGTTATFNGVPYEAFVERKGLGLPTRRDGPPDYTRMKQVLGVWPRISGTQGGTVSVTLGTQAHPDAPVVWGNPRGFILGASQPMLDFSGTAASRVHAIRFSSNDETQWRLHGYDVEIIDRGQR